MSSHDPRLLAYFDLVLEKIAQHPSYAAAVRGAAADGRRLVLNYHTHGPGQGYCASVCARNEGLPDLGGVLRLGDELEELAHIRGVGREEAECRPMMEAFGALLRQRFRLDHAPAIWLDGRPLEARGHPAGGESGGEPRANIP
jgi:hypothetical protein